KSPQEQNLQSAVPLDVLSVNYGDLVLNALNKFYFFKTFLLQYTIYVNLICKSFKKGCMRAPYGSLSSSRDTKLFEYQENHFIFHSLYSFQKKLIMKNLFFLFCILSSIYVPGQALQLDGLQEEVEVFR